MPKTPIDYSQGLIYKIVCKDIDISDCYVGSTTDFTKRKAKHKSACNHENHPNYKYPVYQKIREKGGFDNWEMVLVENYDCANGKELTQRERYHMEQ